MFFQKPVNQLEYSDIEQLVLSGEPESVALDYKASISGSDRDKAEIAKDVSAMANSQGGYIIIGVAEAGGKPVHPPVGIDRMLGQQKVEEWIDQVVAANVAQRVSVHPRPIDIPSTDRCILVIHTPMSPRAPHMVTCRGDNRYYRRYFKRHQYQSLPAEEYEVREMFERSQRFTDQRLAYLERKGYLNPTVSPFEPNLFGRNVWSERLGASCQASGERTRTIDKASSWAAFVACPNHLEDAAIDTSREAFWQWFDPQYWRYPPCELPFLLSTKRTTLEGVVRWDEWRESPRLLEAYLSVDANGYVEFGYNAARLIDGEWYFAFVPMMGFFWWFIGFVTDLYSREGLSRPFRVMLNMVETQGSQLIGLGKGWLGPFSQPRNYVAKTLEHNIQIVHEMQHPSLGRSEIEEMVRYFATKVDNAYGQRVPRCYNNPQHDPQARFPVESIIW